MNPSARFEIPVHVMTREIEGECLILDVANGVYFGLDPLGLRIWQLIAEAKSFEEIRDCLLLEFDVSRDILTNDMTELMESLEKHQLIIKK